MTSESDRTPEPPRRARRRGKPADGAQILDAVEDIIRRHVILPSEPTYVALSLWIAATHAVRSWQHAPRLAIVSPKKQSGKTRVLEVVESLCYRPIKTANVTPAVLFRIATNDPPTILVDEADAVFGLSKIATPNAEDLRAFYNAGFQRGEKTMRVAPNNKDINEYNTFAMVALCSIRDLPDTIMDRAIVLRMRRRANGEEVQPWRTRHLTEYSGTQEKLHGWIRSAAPALGSVGAETPLVDRPADVWEPLLVVADLAGGEWRERARVAAKEMVETESISGVTSDDLRLLADIREVWPDDELRVHSAVLVNYLNSEIELGWHRFHRGLELGPVELAKMLQPFEIRPTQMKIAGTNRSGYHRADFDATWRSYLDDRA